MSDWRRFSRGPRPPPPAHGVQVAAIGATWWGKRWIEALEQISPEYRSRLARGRTYARAGRVHDLAVDGGRVVARVTGSRPRPYEVRLAVAALPPAAWDAAIAAMGQKVLFAAELLAGRMPRDIDQAFRAAGGALFPSARADLATECSCPDLANPCKHVAAAHYVLGEAFDKDPFLLFELRGRGRTDVLGALREARAGRATAAAPRRTETVSLAGRDPAELERAGSPLGALRFEFGPPAAGGPLARLGCPPSWTLDESPDELLGPVYRRAAERARALALAADERAADHEAEAGPTDRAAPDGASRPARRRRAPRR